MWDNFSLYINFSGNRILLKTLLANEPDSSQVWLSIQISKQEIIYNNKSAFNLDLESFVSVPLVLLNKIGLIDSQNFIDFTQRKGVFPNQYNGNAHLRYYLYIRERQNEVFLLQHEIPSPSINSESPNHQQVVDNDFSNIPLEEHIQRYGCSFHVMDNHVDEKRGMIYVPWKYKFRQIPLYPLLAVGLTSIATIQKLGGDYIFDKEESLG